MKKTPLPCLLAVLCAASTHAASFTWDGSEFATSTNWSTAANWSGGVIPDNDGTATVNFLQSVNPGSFSSIVDTAYNINKLIIRPNDTSGTAFTFTGSTLTFSGTGAQLLMGDNYTANNTAATTLSNNIVLAANLQTQAGNGGNAGQLRLSGNISGNFSITMLATTGGFRLSGDNTFTGGVAFSRGTFEIGSDTAIGTGALTVSNGTAGSSISAIGTRIIENDIIWGTTSSSTTAFSGNLTVNGDFQLAGVINGTTLTNSRTLATSSSLNTATVVFNGDVTQDLTGGGTSRNLNIAGGAQAASFTFNGDATYTGQTQITSAATSSSRNLTVRINGDFSSSSGVRITNTGTSSSTVTLGGTGTVSGITIGDVAIDTDGKSIISPGLGASDIGTLNVEGDVIFLNNSVYNVNLAAAGSSDKLAITGGNILFTDGINTGTNAVLSLNITGGYANLTGNYTLATFDSIIGSYGSFAMVTLNGGTVDTLADLQSAGYSLVYGSDGIYLQSSSVPEPASVALLFGLGTLGFVIWGKRSRPQRNA